MPVDVPEGRGDLWAAPEWFNDEQRAEWAYALDNAPLGLLTATDRGVLAIWCVASVEYAKAVAEVRRLGQVVKTAGVTTRNEKTGVTTTIGGSPIQNPFLGIVNRQAMVMLRSGAEMGFSPASRMAFGKGGDDDRRPFATRRSDALDDYLAQKPDRLDS